MQVVSQPFFSVIIPTKSRGHIIGYAIQSALNQTFEDFEIVIIDNDDGNETKQVVDQFDDPRIKYYRTGNLSMADNWEYGCQQAQGEYLTILPDRQLLYARALNRIHDVINKTNTPILSWKIDTINNVDPQKCVYSGLHSTVTKNFKSIQSHNILHTFMQRGYHAIIYDIPTGLRSCLHRSVKDKIVLGPAGRLCLPSAPDFTMAFLQMAYYDDYLQLDEALAASAWGDSNGYQLIIKRPSHVKRFMSDVGKYVALDYLPIQSTQLITNITVSDFIHVQQLVGLNLEQVDFDIVAYFRVCYEEIVERTKQGIDMNHEEQLWTDAFRQQPADIKSSIEEQIKSLNDELNEYRNPSLSAIILKQLKYQSRRPIGKIKYWLGRNLDTTLSPIFPDLISAIRWEAKQPHNSSQQ